ncbi:MAG TPA: DsbE family thiol:disulfide interchange protein [Nevskiaceae bacterium]|nr:DsbE family thiol:disulfide interchange protein [Nevskiaceae bacterium]
MRFLIPLALALGLVALLGVGLTLKPGEVPSPLIGKPVPAFALPVLGGDGLQDQRLLQGRPRLVNFWASWCTPCLEEHPLLLRLAREQGVEIIGINYKDEPAAAQAWLSRHGNPFQLILADRLGSAGLDWGVYGVPETFLIGADGRILAKHIGPLNEAAWRERLAPLWAGGGA